MSLSVISRFVLFLNGEKEQTDLDWAKSLFHTVTTRTRTHTHRDQWQTHTYGIASLSLPIQRSPLSAVLPGTFGGGESDQAPMSIQSTQGSSVLANYSSHLIWEGEGGETDERAEEEREGQRERERERRERLATSGTCAFLQEQWITCSHHLSRAVPSVAHSIADRMTVFVQYRASHVGIGWSAFHWALDINNRLDSRWQNNVCIYFFCYYQAFCRIAPSIYAYIYVSSSATVLHCNSFLYLSLYCLWLQ